MADVFIRMTREEGFLSLFKGWVAGIHRQCAYAGLRLMMYEPIRDFFHDVKTQGEQIPLYKKIAAGIVSGAIAITIASPADLVKIRLQSDRTGETKRYKGAMDAYKKIVKTQGVRGLWVGVVPNAVRNSIINAAELASYDEVKYRVLKYNLMKDGKLLIFDLTLKVFYVI